MSDQYAEFARRYTPHGKLRILFVAEAPPNSTDRYFYFEDVKRGDWLWIALMKLLYPNPNIWNDTKKQRLRKPYWLAKFREDKFQLIDAVKIPISGRESERVLQIERYACDLVKEIETIAPREIVLIKKSVFNALFTKFKNCKLPVANREYLPFPCSGQQTEFHQRASTLECVKEFVKERESENLL